MANQNEDRWTIEEFLNFFNNKDAMGNLVGHKLIELNTNQCLSQYQARPEHYNPNGILHGGALYTAMDSAQGAFIHYILDKKYRFAATGTATIKYFAPVKSGLISIQTSLSHTENRKFFVSSKATNEQDVVVAQLDEIWIATEK